MAWRSRSIGRLALSVVIMATARAVSAAADQVVFQRGVSPTTSYTATSEPARPIYIYTTSSTPGNPVSLYLNEPRGAREIAYFDISSLPQDATVTQAVLRYYCDYPPTPIRGAIFIYRVRTNWLGGAAWTNAGGDWADANGTPQGTVPYATFQATGVTGWFNWDVTALVQGWMRGDFPNYGMLIIASSSAQGYAKFRGSGYNSNPTLRPRLEVTYTASSGDTTAPTGTVTINSAAATTQTTAVTLALSATDNSGTVSHMQLSNDGTTYSAAEAYATTKSWTLAAGDGTKTVYAKFKDAAGNWSSAASDTIVLDSTAPTISAQSASSITAAGATITWTTNEAATSQVDYGTTTSYGQSTALNASLVTSHSVGLGGLSASTMYHYRVRSKDSIGNEGVSGDATLTTAAPPSDTTGTILREYWTGVAGWMVSDLTTNPNYPNNPSGSSFQSLFEAPANWIDYYGTRMRGYIHPPTSGSYVFWIASDDNSELWLSTTADPANKALIAKVPGWTSSQEWTKYPEQQSVAISLAAGQKYYIEALQKDGYGGDNLAVGWQLQGGAIDERPIPGNRLSPFATGTTDTTPPVISAQSVSNITASGATITWTTNEAATSQVDYGATTSYGQTTTLNTAFVTSHSASLSGLSASTLYHYRTHSKDAAGNERLGADATFTTAAASDTTPPSGSITINSGTTATNNTSVSLTLSATDNSGSVAQMQFSNDGTTYSAAEAFATSKTWTLTSGDGTKTVYAKFKDAAGNWSIAVSDTITLDTTPPTLSFTSPTDGQVIVEPMP